MRNKKKNFVRTAISSLLIAVLLASVLLTGCQYQEETPNTETEENFDNLQNFEFPDFEPIWGQTAYPGEYSKGHDVTIDYAYSDRYFDFDANIYNPSLATMSLCMQLSSWSSYEVKAWAGKTRNVRKLLSEIGFVDYAQNDFWSKQPSLDSIGVVAAHKKFEDFTLIALPVRGGNYYNEWGNNADLGPNGYHTGFSRARDNVIAFLEDYIAECNITGRIKLWVTGYSRGGAVANLIAGYYNENPMQGDATLAFEDLYCYTFEAPQGAISEAIGENMDHSNIHNIINANDIVPMVAPIGWDFTRYNSTSRLLPTVTTAQFESARDTMLEEFEEILAGDTITNQEATEYRISEYAKTIQVDFNPMNFLPSGDPLLEIKVVDDTRQTMNEMLTQFLSSFVESVGGRDKFYEVIQPDLVLLLELLKGYETGFDMDAVIDTVLTSMTENDYENLKYVLAPAIQMDDSSVEERISQVIVRLHEVLPQPEGFSDLYGTAGTLIQAIGTMLVNHPEDVLDVALAFTNSNVMQAHHQEITLAWVRAGDPHYTDTPYTMLVPQTFRTVRVNCPVDVRVYDSSGELVACVINDVCTTYNEVVGCAINKDGEIVLHLPSDEEYHVESTATGDGEVNITLSEYNIAHSTVTRVQNYTEIPVVTGDTLTLEAPTVSEEEFTDEEQQGSTAEYRLLTDEDIEIPFEREDRGNDVTYFTVSVGQDSEYGMVTGGGQYLDGSFAMVEAQPRAGSTFDGWYADGALVSADPAYRFAVDKDVSLVARFTEAKQYQVNFATSGEGTVDNAAQAYTAGSQIQLSAVPGQGFAFDHWETTSGSIANTTSPQTVLVVGEQDATVTAFFRDAACANCKEELAQGESHVPACKTAGHYTCDGKYHYARYCGHYACVAGDHNASPCQVPNHYNCSGYHHAAECGTVGHVVCLGDHAAAACGVTGHHNCSGSHAVAACGTAGHYDCDNRDHTTLNPCGHPICAEGDHTAGACRTDGHYLCSGDHGPAPCGDSTHFTCSGNHAAGSCGAAGHYNCSGDHAAGSCGATGHYICDGGDHTSLRLCGHPVCTGGDHDAGDCGNTAHFNCEGDHAASICGTAGHYNCSGDHAAASCGTAGHYVCDGNDHGVRQCGHPVCAEGDHTSTHDCGHFVCATGDHTPGACITAGHYSCDGAEHGYYSCSVHLKCGSGGNLIMCEKYCDICHEWWCEDYRVHNDLDCWNEANSKT